ncbi:LCCL domain-containing protein [Apiospora marii]|uniref:LCCL domain-containing protein n=1 Tax=Apiospora marii TaxID=335849 RepID=UPI00312E0B81
MSSTARLQASASSKEPKHASQRWNGKPTAAVAQPLPSARWFRQKLPRSGPRTAVYLGVSLLCSLAVLILSSTGSGVPPMEVADGVYQPVEQLSCTDSFWLPDNGCGIEGEKCQPFSDNKLAFRCPAHCVAAAKQSIRSAATGGSTKEKPHYVGPETITDGRPLVVGAGPYFRADSHICAAAVYSGLLEDAQGGCGVAETSGMTSMFPEGSYLYGVAPVPLRTYFPMAFRFKYDSGVACGNDQSSAAPSDRRMWVMPLLVAAAYTALVFLFSSSTAVPALSAAAAGFLVTRTAMSGPDVSALPAHFRTAAKSGHFLPAAGAFLVALACVSLLVRLSARRSPPRFAATYDGAALWLGAFWLGLLSLYLFPWVSAPLSTPVYYWVMVLLILLPEAKLRDRARAGLQALLLGLFVYSIASTGLALPFSADSTPSLTNHHANSAPPFIPSPRYPQILEPEVSVGYGGSNATFAWRTPVPDGVDGISMLVNDVERERKHFSTGAGKNGRYGSFELRRTPQAVPDYIRFSWLQGDRALGWSEAGTWEIDGAWSGVGRG